MSTSRGRRSRASRRSRGPRGRHSGMRCRHPATAARRWPRAATRDRCGGRPVMASRSATYSSSIPNCSRYVTASATASPGGDGDVPETSLDGAYSSRRPARARTACPPARSRRRVSAREYSAPDDMVIGLGHRRSEHENRAGGEWDGVLAACARPVRAADVRPLPAAAARRAGGVRAAARSAPECARGAAGRAWRRDGVPCPAITP